MYIDKPKTSYQFIVYRYFFDDATQWQPFFNSNWNSTQRLTFITNSNAFSNSYLIIFSLVSFPNTCMCLRVRNTHWLCQTCIQAQSHFFFHWKLISVLLCINHKMWTILHKKRMFFSCSSSSCCELCCFRRKWSEMKKSSNIWMRRKTTSTICFRLHCKCRIECANERTNQQTNEIHVELLLL